MVNGDLSSYYNYTGDGLHILLTNIDDNVESQTKWMSTIFVAVLTLFTAILFQFYSLVLIYIYPEVQ